MGRFEDGFGGKPIKTSVFPFGVRCDIFPPRLPDDGDVADINYALRPFLLSECQSTDSVDFLDSFQVEDVELALSDDAKKEVALQRLAFFGLFGPSLLIGIL